MTRLRRHSGLWKDAERYRKHNGIWKPISERFRRVGSIWQQTYSSGWVIEGSWETGWEGWGPGGAYLPTRNAAYARTGAWGVNLSGAPGSAMYLDYVIPSFMAARYIKCSAYFCGLISLAKGIQAKVGNGSFSEIARMSRDALRPDFELVSGVISNPLLQEVTIRIFGSGGISGHGCDDWKIESLSVPSIGGAFEGGFYAGDMEVDGVNYMHILADVADAQSLEWGGYDPVLVTNARSETDSKANTDILVNHSRTYAAAEYCRNYRGGGFDDWDLPAVQVLEMCGANFASGPQAVTGAYWSSTEASSGNAVRVAFPQFQRGNHNKGAVYTARPVRRIRIANP